MLHVEGGDLRAAAAELRLVLPHLDVLDDDVAQRAARLLAEVYLRQDDSSAASGDSISCLHEDVPAQHVVPLLVAQAAHRQLCRHSNPMLSLCGITKAFLARPIPHAASEQPPGALQTSSRKWQPGLGPSPALRRAPPRQVKSRPCRARHGPHCCSASECDWRRSRAISLPHS